MFSKILAYYGGTKGTSCGFDVFANANGSNILAQLVFHSPTVVGGTSIGGIVTCIYCMVWTMDLFIDFFAS